MVQGLGIPWTSNLPPPLSVDTDQAAAEIVPTVKQAYLSDSTDKNSVPLGFDPSSSLQGCWFDRARQTSYHKC